VVKLVAGEWEDTTETRISDDVNYFLSFLVGSDLCFSVFAWETKEKQSEEV
jgi:hypothetical protein